MRPNWKSVVISLVFLILCLVSTTLATSDAAPVRSLIEVPPDGPGSPKSMSYGISLFCAACFIFCLKGLSTPKTATRGNYIGMIGMFIAVLIGFSRSPYYSWDNSVYVDSTYMYWWLGIMVVAAVLGLSMGLRINMINLPQTIASFHSAVGLAATLVGLANFLESHRYDEDSVFTWIEKLETYLAVIIGAITFVGSVIATLKLADMVKSQLNWNSRFRHTLNLFLLVAILTFMVLFVVFDAYYVQLAFILCGLFLSLILGFLLIHGIGGADMPVVVSMLNSYSGWTTSAAGLMLNNSILVIAGALIGSSGAILSYVMCKGMNRTLINVIAGGFGNDNKPVITTNGEVKKFVVKETNPKQLGADLLSAKTVIIAPGYGMAVAKCQFDLAEIVHILHAKKVNVLFAMHPVAGRMPGHLSVLLAEANIPYECVKEMDEINEKYLNPNNLANQADICFVVGANDIVNPLSKEKGNSISGMPTIQAWNAKKSVVSKRSLAAGYANLENPLFFNDNNVMLFGNAKDVMKTLLNEIVELSKIHPSDAQTDQHSVATKEKKSVDIDEAKEITVAVNDVPLSKTIAVLNEKKAGTPTNGDEKPTPVIAAMAPSAITLFKKIGYKIKVEAGLGEDSYFSDRMYEMAGAEVYHSRKETIENSDIVLCINTPTKDELNDIKVGQLLISQLWPHQHPEFLKEIASRKIDAFAIDNLPRISRAQKIDTRSSMSNLAGYRAVLEAIYLLPKMAKSAATAAGTFPPSKVFVIGAGVAGLQAVITAKALGCIVYCSDSRTITKEQVESCGGKFVSIEIKEDGEGGGGYAKEMSPAYLEEQRKVYGNLCEEVDIVITTAVIPGMKAPKLISKEAIRRMRTGSVVVDMAAEQGDVENGWGGNCELTRKGKIYSDSESGVTLVGITDLPARVPSQASEQWSKNIYNLLSDIGTANDLSTIYDKIQTDEVIKGIFVVSKGEVLFKTKAPVAPPPVSATPATLAPSAPPAASFAQKNSLTAPTITVPQNKLLDAPSVPGTSHMAGSPTPPDAAAAALRQKEAFRVEEESKKKEEHEIKKKPWGMFHILPIMVVSLVICWVIGQYLSDDQAEQFLIFFLAVVCGYHVIHEVTPLLHTPLMSVTNALSGVIVLGAMALIDPHTKDSNVAMAVFVLSLIALFFASFNIFAGFSLTQRVLKMFLKV